MNKSEYYLTPEWHSIAEECKRLANYECSKCNSTEELHAHHLTYDRLGRELQSDLQCLCKKCHERVHGFTLGQGPRFLQRGYKMYNNGVIALIEVLTKDEIKRIIALFDSTCIDYNNILTKSFLQLTSDMSKAARSRYKHKLIDNRVMQECNGKIMLNPFIFVPRGDKNIPNSQHLTQRVWKYLFEDANVGSDEVVAHAERLFGKLPGPTKLLVGSDNFTKLVEIPDDN